MSISASTVKALRDRTGAGFMDCKKALAETDGDVDKAAEYLQIKGIAKAAKKAGRVATEGLVHSYLHQGGRVGVLVEVNCETDFVARNEAFVEFVNDVALHIAAMNPNYLDETEVSDEDKEEQKRIFIAQAIESGKPEHIAEKMVTGKMAKWLRENCLLTQPFVKDPEKTIEHLVKEQVAGIGENIKIRRFARYELGEGLEKKEDDLAAEVAKLTN